MAGEYKGQEGDTKAKSGDKWTVKLGGADRAQSFSALLLHALEPPDWDKAFTPSQAQQVEEALPLEEIENWVAACCSEPPKPVRLVRRLPHSHLWYKVLSKQCTCDSLSNEEVESLRYLFKGPGDDVASMRERLQAKSESDWTITYKCGSATKCGCPFELQLRHRRGSATVEVWEVERHQNHDPTSADERAQLQMHPDVKATVEGLLRCGVKPYMVWWQVTAGQLTAGKACTGSLAAASDARWRITLAQVYAVRKQLQRAEVYGLTSDAAAVAAQMAELAKLGVVRFYQPLKERCDGPSAGTVTIQCEDGMHQPLVIILETPFQQRMLAEFGGRLVFTDSTGGTNKYGYPLQALMVLDEHGRGVPVGFMICSSDTVEVLEKFLRALQQGAQEGGQASFKYGFIMMDKSRQEMAAVRQLVLTGNATNYLLCYFHVLQEWERFVHVDDIVAALVSSGAVEAAAGNGPPGLTVVKKAGEDGSARACLSDLSCTCGFSSEAICVHLRAAAEVVGFTQDLRAAGAKYLVEHGQVEVDAETGICRCVTLAHQLKPVHFRPQEGSCTCHDHAMHGTCCHMPAAQHLPAVAGVEVLMGIPAAGGERIVIHKPRTFQQPTREPLGAHWGKAEMCGLLAVQGSTAAAIKRAQSNADPAVAGLRNDLGFIERITLSLPEGEEKESLLQHVAEVRIRAAEAAARTNLPPTAPRAGKMQRRQAGRPEGQRKVTALQAGRKHSSKRPLAQQDGSYGDEFKRQAKKGRTTEKVRGVTIEGNVMGTTQRSGSHPRYRKLSRR